MSKELIDHWLDDVEFEDFRLSFRPTALHLELLRAQIQRMESMPVTEEASGDLERTISRLDRLKQDLRHLQDLSGIVSRAEKVRYQVQEKGMVAFRPEEANEILDDIHSWLQELKHKQRLRQHVTLGYFTHFWPMADQARRKRMIGLFATYGKKRLMWGARKFAISTPLKFVRWVGRSYKK